MRSGFTRLPKSLAQETKTQESPCWGESWRAPDKKSQMDAVRCTWKQGEGPYHFLLMPGGNLWPEYINWRWNFFFRCSSWWNLLRPPPAASLDLCPALLVVWALGPMIANDSLPCPWSHFNLLLGHGQDAELSLWAMHINLAGNSVLKKNFKKGSKPSPKYIPASGSKMLWAVTPGKS